MKNLMFMLAFAASALIAFSSCGDSKNNGGDDDSTVYNHETHGIQGHWLSEDENVAPVLVQYFGITKITATFRANNTYSVVSYDTTDDTVNYTGTYTQTKSTVDGIWNIVLNQSSPSAATSEGIFQITKSGDDYTMKYEVVQTEPSLGTPPTATEGFGSSSGGTLGETNIQVFVRTGDL